MAEAGGPERRPGRRASEAESERSEGAGAAPELADVPRDRLEEVRGVLEDLAKGVPGGGVGGISDLREWLYELNHITGFSREATVQLCAAMSRCLVAARPVNAVSSTGDLQQTFVRMGGVRNIVDAMVARLQDSYVVTACLRVLSAICQGSPVASDILQSEGNTVRLLLRTIERHASADDVAEAGCALIGHLCAPLASDGGQVVPTRSQAHRTCQQSLAEAGALDLLVDIITANTARVVGLARQAEESHARAVRAGQLVAKKGADSVKGKVERVKASMEARQVWERYHAEEAAAAHIQEVALHALTLIATDNEHTVRMLAGALWCWNHRRKREEELAARSTESRPESRGSGSSASSRPSQASVSRSQASSKSKSSRAASSRTSRTSRTSRSASRQSTKDSAAASSVEGLDISGDARQASTTLESFAGSMALVVDVLTGPTARDRPALAARACRLLSVLARHQLRMRERLALESQAQAKQLEVKLRCDPGRLDDRHPEEPFAPLRSMLSTLIATVRTHLHDAPLLTVALEALAQVREVAMMSTPAGVPSRGDEARSRWRALLAEVEGAGEFGAAKQVLQKALHSTQVANQRIEGFKIEPSELVGEGIWLTPRMKAAAENSVRHAEALARDIVAASWHNGDPERLDRKLAPKGLSRRRSSAGRRLSRDSRDEAPSPAASDITDGEAGLPGLPEDSTVEAPTWKTALGYFEHDEADFKRIWRKPLTEALTRTFSCPDVPGRSQARKESDALDQLLQVELLHSAPGKLRARCIVQPRNKLHQKVRHAQMSRGVLVTMVLAVVLVLMQVVVTRVMAMVDVLAARAVRKPRAHLGICRDIVFGHQSNLNPSHQTAEASGKQALLRLR